MSSSNHIGTNPHPLLTDYVGQHKHFTHQPRVQNGTNLKLNGTSHSRSQFVCCAVWKQGTKSIKVSKGIIKCLDVLSRFTNIEPCKSTSPEVPGPHYWHALIGLPCGPYSTGVRPLRSTSPCKSVQLSLEIVYTRIFAKRTQLACVERRRSAGRRLRRGSLSTGLLEV